MRDGKNENKIGNDMWGIQSDAGTFMEMFQEMEKRNLKTRKEREKFMVEFFSNRKNKIQDVIIGKSDLEKKIKGKRVIRGDVKNGRTTFTSINDKKKKKNDRL